MLPYRYRISWIVVSEKYEGDIFWFINYFVVEILETTICSLHILAT